MSLPKDILNNFTETMFTLRDTIKNVSDQYSKLLFLGNPNLHNTIGFYNKSIDTKSLK